jgi:hypothetical protein
MLHTAATAHAHAHVGHSMGHTNARQATVLAHSSVGHALAV